MVEIINNKMETVKKKLRPTLMQGKAIKSILQGSTITQAMKDAGYAPATCGNTGKLTRSNVWKELVENHLPDSLLVKTHQEGLKATVKKPHIIDRDAKGNPVYGYVKEVDFATRHRYLETAYKIKNKMPKETPIAAVQINFKDNDLG